MTGPGRQSPAAEMPLVDRGRRANHTSVTISSAMPLVTKK